MADPKDRGPALSGAYERLRHRIDLGKTHDKVGAPLGTDAEAGAGHDEQGLRTARNAGPRQAIGKDPDRR